MTSEKLKAEILALLTPKGKVFPTYVLRNWLADPKGHTEAPSIRRALKTSRVLRLCKALEADGLIEQDAHFSGPNSISWRLK